MLYILISIFFSLYFTDIQLEDEDVCPFLTDM